MEILRIRYSLLLALIAATLLSGAVAIDANACDEASVSELNTDAKGLALRGYDPVAYFQAGAAIAGKPPRDL